MGAVNNGRCVGLPRLLLLLLAFLVAWVAYSIARTAADERRGLEFEARSRAVVTEVEQNIERSFWAVDYLRLLFDSSDRVDPDEFKLSADDLLFKRCPWIRVLAWAPSIQSGEREQRLDEIKRSGLVCYRGDNPSEEFALPDFEIRRFDELAGSSGGDVRRSGFAEDDPTCYPLVYVELALEDRRLRGRDLAADPEPREVALAELAADKRKLLGLDLATEPRRYGMLQEARRSSDLVMSGPLAMALDPPETPAILVFAAVRNKPVSSSAYAESRLLGIVMMGARCADLLEHTRDKQPQIDRDLRFRLTDVTDPASPALMYSNMDDFVPGAVRRDDVFARESLTIARRQLMFEARPTAAWLAGTDSSQPLLIALLAFGGVALFGCWLIQSLQRNQRAASRDRDVILESVFTSLNEGVVVADRKANIIFCNDVAHRLLGPIERIPPLDWASVCGLFLEDAKTACPVERLPLVRAMRGERVFLERLFVKNDENPDGAWLSVSGSPLLDDDDRLRGGVAVIRDITDRRNFEAKVRRLSAVVEQTADLVFITGADGRVVYVNPAFEARTGWSTDEVVGEPPRIFATNSKAKEQDKDDPFDALCADLKLGSTYRGLRLIRCKDGGLFRTEVTITPIRDVSNGGRCFVSVCKDISDRLLHQQQELEMQLAAAIQRRLYPTQVIQMRGLDVAGRCYPARTICGDYFDYIRLPDGSLAIIVADIAGSGLGAAMLMAETRAYLRSLLLTGLGMAPALRQLCTWIEPDLSEGSYVTMLTVVIDPDGRGLHYYNAGHWPGVVLDPQGRVKLEMSSSSTALGLKCGEVPTASVPIPLDVGDTILLMTDGVFDARCDGDDRFGMERVVEAAAPNTSMSAAQLVQLLRDRVVRFAGDKLSMDDQTIVVCRAVDASVPDGPQKLEQVVRSVRSSSVGQIAANHRGHQDRARVAEATSSQDPDTFGDGDA